MSEQPVNAGFEGSVINLIPSLRGYARSLHRNNLSEADDLVQETLLRAIQHVDTFRPGTNLRAWMFTIMRNRFYATVVKARREPIGKDVCVSDSATVQGNQESYMELREVEKALIGLPPHYRETLTFVVIAGGSYEAAAKKFQCDIGTIKSRISRSRKMIRDLVSR